MSSRLSEQKRTVGAEALMTRELKNPFFFMVFKTGEFGREGRQSREVLVPGFPTVRTKRALATRKSRNYPPIIEKTNQT